jgi:hypothetical protein
MPMTRTTRLAEYQFVRRPWLISAVLAFTMGVAVAQDAQDNLTPTIGRMPPSNSDARQWSRTVTVHGWCEERRWSTGRESRGLPESTRRNLPKGVRHPVRKHWERRDLAVSDERPRRR